MIGKFIISEDDAKTGCICPFCHHYVKSNGLGPENNKALTRVLSFLPSTSVLVYGARFHDFCYHYGPYWGTREEADLLMYQKNEEEINRKCRWYSRWWYRRRNLQNYQAVREFGESSYNAKGCDGRYVP
jgi:hypothetical protein